MMGQHGEFSEFEEDVLLRLIQKRKRPKIAGELYASKSRVRQAKELINHLDGTYDSSGILR